MSDKKPFNEDSLREMISKQWGEHGAHIDVFDDLVKLSKGNIPNWISERADSERKKEERRKERIRNLLTGLTFLVDEKGTEDHARCYNGIIEALRHDITLEELESIRIEKMSPNVFQESLLGINVHPLTYIIRIDSSKIKDQSPLTGFWYLNFPSTSTLTVRQAESEDIRVVPERYFVVDNGEHMGKVVRKNHAIIISPKLAQRKKYG